MSMPRKVSLGFFPAESKGNDISFDSQKHESLLKNGGWLTIHDNHLDNRCIYIDRVDSYFAGYGTAAMRHVVERSLQEKYQGNVMLDASKSSHVFHLYMGMIPVDHKITAAEFEYGEPAKNAIIKVRDDKPLDEVAYTQLTRILHDENKLSRSQARATKKDITANRVFLESLIGEDKKCSYLKNRFIPDLLDILRVKGKEEDESEEKISKRPDTAHFGGVLMTLSSEGKERWKNAINKKIEFEPFRNFAQLHPYMSEKQKDELTEILKARSEALAKNKNQNENAGQYTNSAPRPIER